MILSFLKSRKEKLRLNNLVNGWDLHAMAIIPIDGIVMVLYFIASEWVKAKFYRKIRFSPK
jgi:hypothetical protein